MECALSRRVETDDRSVDKSRFDIFDAADDDGTDPDEDPSDESVPDRDASVELMSDGDSVLAEIEIKAGQTRDLLWRRVEGADGGGQAP